MKDDFGSVPAFLKRAAQQSGFERERYIEANVPTDFSDVVIMPFFGDMRSEAILSSLLLHPYLKRHWHNKYFILCSWQGHAGLFPYVQEYWSLGDQLLQHELSDKAFNFNNKDTSFDNIAKNLRKYIDTVLTWEDLAGYYQDDGLTKEFFAQFGEAVRFLPGLPAVRIEFSKELIQRNSTPVMIFPARLMRTWNKRDLNVPINYDFWNILIGKLIGSGYLPVVYQNYSTYDMSRSFGDKCLYITDNNILSLLTTMRACGCVLDVFSGISRIAMLARCPFVVMDERSRYVRSKEYEINDLCIAGTYPYRYIMSFPTILESGNFPEMSDHLVSVLNTFTSDLDSAKLASSSESYVMMPYSGVRKHKEKKLGVHFIKVERLVIT